MFYTDDPGHGGVAQYNFSMLRAFAARGWPTTLIQQESRIAGDLASRLGIKHEWLGFDTAKEFGRTVVNHDQARDLFARHTPQFVFFSDCCPFSNLAARDVAIELGIPFINVVGFVAPYLVKTFDGLQPTLTAHYAASRAVVAVSQENLTLLTTLFGLPPGKGAVIHYGRPDEYFAPPSAAARVRIRAKLNIPPGATVCFTAARLEMVKGFQYQLAAIQRLQQTPAWPLLHFIWAGGGSLDAQLRAYLQQSRLTTRVHMIGHQDLISGYLDASDIFVLPSEAEGMPLAIMEAMAKGLPVIASAVSGIPEELGDTGCLLPDPVADENGAINRLASCIHDWTTTPKTRQAAGAACKARANTMFRESRMVDQTMAVVQQATA